MKLYDLELSGNSYRVRLLLTLLGLKHEAVTVNLMKSENREPWFLKLNPRGQVPTLDDGGTVVWDSMAILVYLARKYGGEKWLPIDPQGMAEVMQWLALDHVTIADIACFPYVALASEGEIPLDPYASVRSWIERIKALPGFVGMPGI
jgi:glutathione S-transferase